MPDKKKRASGESKAALEALGKSLAMAELDLNGKILFANRKYLIMMGYTLREVQGKEYGLFIEAAYQNSRDYADFWGGLRCGESLSGMFKRIGKDGKEVWVHSFYSPVLGQNGTPLKIIELAVDITREKLKAVDF